MPRPSILHVLAASGLALTVAVPVAAAPGLLPAAALTPVSPPAPDPDTPQAWASAAQAAQAAHDERATATLAAATADGVRAHGHRLQGRALVARVQAEQAERAAAAAAAAQAEADRVAAEQAAEQAAALAARQAEADRVSRERRAARDPRAVARELLAARGQAGQFSCLDSLWTKESGWKTTADNPTSSAYGIPQALPGRKMASAGDDWQTNPETQIRWGLGYIDDVYGSPCAAWQHSQAHDWY